MGDRTSLYLSVPADRRAAVKGLAWVIVPGASPGARAGAGVGPLPDPISVFEAPAGAVGPVEDLGADVVLGAKAKRYRCRIDLRRLATALDGRGDAQAASLQRLGSLVVPADVWLDERGRTVRVRISVDVPAPNRRVTADVTATAFGRPVEIGVPAPGSAFPARDLADALQFVGAGS